MHTCLIPLCAMASPAKKRAKSIFADKEPVTTIENPDFDKNDVAEAKTVPKMTFRSPVTIENVFRPPAAHHVKFFYQCRAGENSQPFDQLLREEKVAWTESFHDNKALMGFIVYTMLFPKLLQTRIKLNAATYHWAHLDAAADKGRVKLEQRREAYVRLKRDGVTQSVFMGLPQRTSIDPDANILDFMNINVDEEDERFRFFIKREFSILHAARGQVANSSVYTSCAMALSLLWFATTVLARPCCLESIILPLSVIERRKMEQQFHCPPEFFDGPVHGFQTDWKHVFATIGTRHRNIDYTLLEKVSEHRYIEGVHVADTYAVYRAAFTAPKDRDAIAALLESYKKNSKHGVESGAVVGALDVIREKPSHSIGSMDGSVLGSIHMTYGERACLDVRRECIRLDGGGPSLFDTSVGNKLDDILSHFDRELWKERKKDKISRNVASNMDPAGMSKKIEGGKMLDPTDAKSVEKMINMLKALSRQVWRPLKSLVGEALGASMEYPTAFLQISQTEAQTLFDSAVKSRVTYADIDNLCTLLFASFSFQRSQVLREATVHEFELAPDSTCFKLTFKNRRFKTSSSGAKASAPPVSHFMLTPEQSMIIKFVAAVGHKFCKFQSIEPSRRLFVNSKGQNWTQKDITARFKILGRQWLGIQNFGAHISRTFWATHALNSGQISGSNIEDFSSFLQVSSSTLRTSYMAAAANTAAQTLGNEVLGAVVNAACTGETTERGSRPYGRKLSTRRFEFAADIRASVLHYGGNSRNMFRALLQKRMDSQLSEGEVWFRWENTFFSEKDETLFKRFVEKATSA